MRIPFRGVIFFALIWAIILGVPSLRNQTERAAKPVPPFSTGYLTGAEIENGLKAEPQSAFFQSQALIQSLDKAQIPKEKFFRDYTALLAKHPTDLVLVRNYLRFANRGNIIPNKYTARYAPPSVADSTMKPWLEPNELKQVVGQARAARKLAPNDAFFPWMEALALWGLGRENDSLAALQQAGKCSTFNDGSMDEMRQRFAFLKKARSLEWDDELAVFWSALFPQFAVMRRLSREVAYSGVGRFRAGDKAEEWRRWEIAVRAGHAVRVGQKQGYNSTIIGLLVGEALESLVFEVGAGEAANYQFTGRRGSGLSVEEAQQRSREVLVAFVQAAKRAKKNDLAQLAASDGSEIIANQIARHSPHNYTDTIDAGLGWKSPLAIATIQIRWLGERTLLWVLAGIVGAVVALLVSRSGRNSRVGTNTVVSLSTFLGILWLGLAIVAMWNGVGSENYKWIFDLTGASQTMPFVAWDSTYDFWCLGLTFVAIALGREWGSRRSTQAALRAEAGNRTRQIDTSKWLVFVVWGVAILLSLLLWFDARSNATLVPSAAVVIIAWITSLIIGIVLAVKSSSIQPRQAVPVALNTVLALALFVVSSMALKSDAAFWGTAILSIICFVLWIWNGKNGLWSWTRIAANLETCGRVFAGISLVISLGYLLSSLALMPERAQLNERVDSYVQLGEIEWLRTQAK